MYRCDPKMLSLHDRGGRGRIALRGALGCLLVLLATSAISMHGHDLGLHQDAPLSVVDAGGSPAPLGHHAFVDLLDCQICELSRRGEIDGSMLPGALFLAFDLERPLLGVLDLVAAPRAPTRGRPSPRAPPVFSV